MPCGDGKVHLETHHLTMVERREEASTPWGWLVLLTAMAAVLRSIGVDNGLWYDEILSLLESVRAPFSEIVTNFPSNNQHTLYSLLAHASIGVFGEHAWSLRLPAVLFGIATVPMLFVFARQCTTSTEALLACLLLTVSYHHVWFSQNARGYSAAAFFTLLNSWLLLRGLQRGRAADFAWYGVAAALGVYAHLPMVFLVVSHAALSMIALGWPGIDPTTRSRWRLPAMGFALAGLFTLLLYAPLLLGVRRFFVDEEDPVGTATAAWAVLEMVRGLHLGWFTWIGALAGLALAICGMWSYWKQSRLVLGLLVLPGAMTAAATIGLQRPVRPRLLFFVAGFAILIVVRGALDVARWLQRNRAAHATATPAAGVALVVLLSLASAATLVPGYQYPKQDFEGAMRFVESRVTEGESIVTLGQATLIYSDYYHRTWEGITSVDHLQRVLGRGRRVWALYTLERTLSIELQQAMEALRPRCDPVAVFRGTLGDGDISVCATPPATAPIP